MEKNENEELLEQSPADIQQEETQIRYTTVHIVVNLT